MSEQAGEGLDGLLMGDVSEDVKESDEQFAARMAAAQARITKNQKDESKAKDFDSKMVQVLPSLTPEILKIVIYCIDHGIPSLTILAFLSVVNDEAHKICMNEFEKYIESTADFSHAKLPEELEKKISYWWTFIYGADHLSNTVHLRDLAGDTKFMKQMTRYFAYLLQQFIKTHKIEDFDTKALKTTLQKYQTEIFKTPE